MTNTRTTHRRLFTAEQVSFLSERLQISKLEAQLLAARGYTPVDYGLPSLLGREMVDLDAGAARLAAAIRAKEEIVIVADYDCDGATACALTVAGLRFLGGKTQYVVPDRMVHGYGISPSVVDEVRDRYPNATVLVTVDNGILGHKGIEYAQDIGMDVVVTDHHLPGDTLPTAAAVINPSRHDDTSGLQRLAGVGVGLWLVVAVKKHLSALGESHGPLNFLLPYVAIGTVADMVAMDDANRILVSLGLDRMRTGQAPVGVQALVSESGASPRYLTTQDIGFGLGPRINAAGRLETMDLGIDLLLETDPARAGVMARMLSDTNNTRKQLQREASEDAGLQVDFTVTDATRSIVVGDEAWHPGIVGLVASRLKETHNRPTFVFSMQDGLAKGSGRSISGFHLKDALEEVARRAPGVLAKFGGHAMAAGATLSSPAALKQFAEVFNQVATERIEPSMLEQVLLSDGPLPDLDLDSALRILRHPWGQKFEAPAYDDDAKILDVAPLGKDGKHWKIRAQVGALANKVTVVLFNQPQPTVGSTVHLYLQPTLNTWKDSTNLQWLGRVL